MFARVGCRRGSRSGWRLCRGCWRAWREDRTAAQQRAETASQSRFCHARRVSQGRGLVNAKRSLNPSCSSLKIAMNGNDNRVPSKNLLANRVAGCSNGKCGQMKSRLPVVIFCCTAFTAANFTFAQIWTRTGAPTNDWISVTASADGSRLAASASQSIYISTNFGTTWVSNNAPGLLAGWQWWRVSSSADGSQLEATVNAPLGTGLIFISTNSGGTWAHASDYFAKSGAQLWSLASSADGGTLAAGPSAGGYVYVSTNHGSTWNQTGANLQGQTSVAVSADGSRLAAVGADTSRAIETSSDFGVTWITNNAPTAARFCIAASADGMRLITAGDSNSINTSTDGGVTWISTNVPNAPGSLWYAAAASADGKTLVLATHQPVGCIYTSTNSGATWTSNNVPADIWGSVAVSADGSRMVAAASGDGIYVAQTTPKPQLNLTAANGNLAFSWLIPSTNLVLQQNLNLTTTNWATLTNTPALNLTNLCNEVTVSPTNSSGFFRLVSQ